MRNLTKTGARINSRVGKAIHDYKLIEDGDNILIAVSGGKDSLTLLTLLKNIQSWAPVKFTLTAAHIVSDLQPADEGHLAFLKKTFDDLGVDGRFRNISIADGDEKISCFWCSWNRRKALFQLADEIGCNKVALGHHKDDIVETMLMNLVYNGEISGMNPRQELFEGKITIIRPLAYVEEKMTRAFAKESGFDGYTCTCTYVDDSKRKFIKGFIREADKSVRGTDIKTNIFRSMSRIKKEYLDIADHAVKTKMRRCCEPSGAHLAGGRLGRAP